MNRALARDLDPALNRDFHCIVGAARNIARNLDRNIARNLDRDIARALDRDIAAVEFDFDRARDIALALALALNRTRNQVSDRARDIGLDRALDLDIDIAATFGGARALVLRIEQAQRENRAAEQVRRLTPMAGRLLAAAIRLLPTVDQARYLEEFRAELDTIVSVGGSRRTQVVYAARQIASAWGLRAELRAPRRRSATQ